MAVDTAAEDDAVDDDAVDDDDAIVDVATLRCVALLLHPLYLFEEEYNIFHHKNDCFVFVTVISLSLFSETHLRRQ